MFPQIEKQDSNVGFISSGLFLDIEFINWLTTMYVVTKLYNDFKPKK